MSDMAEGMKLEVSYGVMLLVPEPAMQAIFEVAQPPSLTQRLGRAMKSVGMAVAVLAILIMAIVGGSLGLAYIGVGELAGLYGLVVGLLCFMLWDGWRS